MHQAGFDYYDGMMGGGLPPTQEGGYVNWLRQSTKNPEGSTESGYFTSVITDAAIDWLKDNQNQQFFLWLAHLAPQIPLHKPPSQLVSKTPSHPCQVGINTTQAAECALSVFQSLDTEIGRLLDSLSDANRKRTTIIFISDNGPDDAYADGQPFKPKRVKNTLYEGGIRVPLVISGNKVMSKGKFTYSLASTVDIYGTIVEIMGGRPNIMDKFDTVSLVPVMKDFRSTVRDFIFVELKGPNMTCTSPDTNIYYGYGDAFIAGQFKLITRFEYNANNTMKSLPDEFYDVNKDPFELKNLLLNANMTNEQKGALGLIRARRQNLLKT